MINELAELVEMYEQEAWSRGDYFHRITLLVPDFSIDELIHELPIHELPRSDRDDFAFWLRATYDNDVPVDNFVSIGDPGDTALAPTRIDALRAGCGRIVASMGHGTELMIAPWPVSAG